MPTRKSKSRSRSRRSRRGGKSVHNREPMKTNTKPRKEKKKQPTLRERKLESLQALARSHGIPFGGLTRSALIDKLIAYGY